MEVQLQGELQLVKNITRNFPTFGAALGAGAEIVTARFEARRVSIGRIIPS